MKGICDVCTHHNSYSTTCCTCSYGYSNFAYSGKTREEVLEEVRDSMSFHTDNLGGFFTITLTEWNKLKEKNDGM